MSGAPRPDDRGNADRGTELGSGTRFLASAFRLPVRAARAVARALSRIEQIGRRSWLVIAAALVVAGLAITAVAAGPTTAASAAASGIGVALVIALSIALPALVVFGAVKAAPPVGRATAWAARLLWRAIRPFVRAIGDAVVLMARPIGRAIGFVVVHSGRLIGLVAVRIGHAIAHVTYYVGRAVRFVATPIGHAIYIVVLTAGRAVGWVAVHIGRAVATGGRAVGHAFDVLLTPVGRVIARAAAAVSRVVLVPIGRVLAAVGAALGRILARMAYRVAAVIGACTRWLRTRVLRLRHSVGVAAARARQTSTATMAASGAEPPRIAAPPPPFSAEVFHNEYLPSGTRSVDAVITVTAHAGTTDDAGPAPTAEVILVDCSGSMGQPWRKIRAARAATSSAIDALPDGAHFAVVRANHDAAVVYPTDGGLATKTAHTAADARRAVQTLWPEGGTAMGRWLLVARDLLATAPHAIGHAILLTDGKNESESTEALASARRACRGRFQCDCRGVGTDWDVAELRGIAHELLGTVDIVADPADLAADFRAMAEQAAGKRVDGVRLRVWTPADSVVRFIKQVSPSIEDLGVRPARVDARTVDYPTGAWSDESRDYHLSIELPAKPPGTEMLAARVSLIVGDRVLSKALVTATWTEDLDLSTRIVPEVVHYTGQAELLGAVQEGLERRRAGDEAGALERLGEAARRAHEAGNEATLQLLAQVVEIEDAPTGRVRARAVVDDADLMALDTRSTRTTRFAAPPEPVATVSSD